MEIAIYCRRIVCGIASVMMRGLKNSYGDNSTIFGFNNAYSLVCETLRRAVILTQVRCRIY